MSALDLNKFEENVRKYAEQVVDNLMKSDTTAILSEEDVPDDRLMEILKGVGVECRGIKEKTELFTLMDSTCKVDGKDILAVTFTKSFVPYVYYKTEDYAELLKRTIADSLLYLVASKDVKLYRLLIEGMIAGRFVVVGSNFDNGLLLDTVIRDMVKQDGRKPLINVFTAGMLTMVIFNPDDIKEEYSKVSNYFVVTVRYSVMLGGLVPMVIPVDRDMVISMFMDQYIAFKMTANAVMENNRRLAELIRKLTE